MWGKPKRHLTPISADVEGKVVDCAVKTGKTVGVFVIVEGCAREG